MSDTPIQDTYLSVRERIDHLVRPLGDDELQRPVPACPGWRVRDVISHLVGSAEWAMDGRLSGPPDDDQTAEQVAERDGIATLELLDRWQALAPAFADMAQQARIWPAAIDAAAHEQDIRAAVGAPSVADEESTHLLARVTLKGLRPSIPIEVETDTRTVNVGEGEPGVRLRSTDFEVFRFRLGRRSRAQLAAMDWTGDPTPILDELYVFGPAPVDILE